MMKGMIFADRYKLEEFIGQGGMSMVYRAVDVRTGHSVAIKILKSEYNGDKEFLERFQREAQAASLMSHHNIVNLLDVGVEGEHRYLVLEYVSGNTLKEIIQQKGQLSVPTAVQITIRILSALQHAHDNGIIHRDIKPQNVLVNSDGHVKVADFGIARMANTLTLSKSDTVVGSVHYASPEQAAGKVVEATSDLYSTGVVLYEMLTGRVPFTGDTPVIVAMQHVNAPPPPIGEFNPDVSAPVVAVVMKAMEKNPKRRFRSAREMADALIRARDGRLDPLELLSSAPPAPPRAGGQGVRKPPEVRPEAGGRAQTHRRRPRTQTFTTVLMCVLVLGALTFGITQIYDSVTNSATTPEMVGLSVEEAQLSATRAGLQLQQTGVNHDTLPAGLVISQMPDPDVVMRKGDSVVVTVSLGPMQLVAPDLRGLTLEAATAKAKEKGMGLWVIRVASTEPVNTVLSQSPAANEPCSTGTEIEVTVSGGSTLVPELTGMNYEDAQKLLQDNSLIVGRLENVETQDPEQVGIITSQIPAAGTMAVLGAQVTLTVAKKSKAFHGEALITIPAGEANLPFRVTLVEGDAEEKQYGGTTTGGSPLDIVVPVSSDIAGMLICRVYVDGVLVGEQEVELK